MKIWLEAGRQAICRSLQYWPNSVVLKSKKFVENSSVNMQRQC